MKIILLENPAPSMFYVTSKTHSRKKKSLAVSLGPFAYLFWLDNCNNYNKYDTDLNLIYFLSKFNKMAM